MKRKIIAIRPVWIGIMVLIIMVTLFAGCSDGSETDNLLLQEVNQNYQSAVRPVAGKSIVSADQFKQLAEASGAKVDDQTEDGETFIIVDFGSLEFCYEDCSAFSSKYLPGTESFEQNWKKSEEEEFHRTVTIQREEEGDNYYLYSEVLPETKQYYATYLKDLFVNNRVLLRWFGSDSDTVNAVLTESEFLKNLISVQHVADCVDAENAKIILRNYGNVYDDNLEDGLMLSLINDDFAIYYDLKSGLTEEEFHEMGSESYLKDYCDNYNDDKSALRDIKLIRSGRNYYCYEGREDSLDDGEVLETAKFTRWIYRQENTTNVITIDTYQNQNDPEHYQKIMDLLIQTSE